MVIRKAPVEFERQLSHHEEREDHEGKTEHIDVQSPCPSCPSWLNVCDLIFLHNGKILYFHLRCASGNLTPPEKQEPGIPPGLKTGTAASDLSLCLISVDYKFFTVSLLIGLSDIF